MENLHQPPHLLRLVLLRPHLQWGVQHSLQWGQCSHLDGPETEVPGLVRHRPQRLGVVLVLRPGGGAHNPAALHRAVQWGGGVAGQWGAGVWGRGQYTR